MSGESPVDRHVRERAEIARRQAAQARHQQEKQETAFHRTKSLWTNDERELQVALTRMREDFNKHQLPLKLHHGVEASPEGLVHSSFVQIHNTETAHQPRLIIKVQPDRGNIRFDNRGPEGPAPAMPFSIGSMNVAAWGEQLGRLLKMAQPDT
jgi:hypothetical protein